jgi:hypothetical protein
MIAEQAYKGYPKLTNTELYIAKIIMDNPNGIHINSIFKQYPSRNYAVSCALKRLEAFKIAFTRDFRWYPNIEYKDLFR